jgi:hypothetical protein
MISESSLPQKAPLDNPSVGTLNSEALDWERNRRTGFQLTSQSRAMPGSA